MLKQADFIENINKPGMIVPHRNSLASVLAEINFVKNVRHEKHDALTSPAKLFFDHKKSVEVSGTEC